jgi:hypothetical protein
MRFARRLTPILLGTLLSAVAMTSSSLAQDPSPVGTPSPMCSLLGEQEVTEALGVTLTVATSDESGCDYSADYNTGDFLSLSSRRDTGTLDDLKTAFGDGEAIEVAGQAGIYLPDSLSSLMFIVAPDTGIYTLQLVGSPKEGVDVKAALLSLAALALPRLSAVPAVTEPPVPEQSFTADKDLEALFPTEIAGQSLTIDSRTGKDLAAQGSIPDELVQALAAQGKTIDDVSLAFGYYTDSTSPQGNGAITALQVKGVDMGSLSSVLIPLVLNGATPASQTQAQISGKDVTVVKATAETTDAEAQYLYPRNDILWVVQAVDPGLTEIFSKLP